MARLNDTRVANNNVATEDQLITKINSIESQVIVWMAEAAALHSAVDVADRPQVLDLRTDLIAKLTAATAI